MFGLYPAGPRWVRHFSSKQTPREIQQLLTENAGFTAGVFHQPFGDHRGAVIAQKGNCLILAAAGNANSSDLVAVPDVQTQNLLWSFNSGYANQWGARELHALTGCDNWDALLKMVSAEFADVCDAVRRAADGTLARRAADAAPDPVVGMMFSNDDDVPWVPSEYLYDAPAPEGSTCAP
jgi:hypothetical protein